MKVEGFDPHIPGGKSFVQDLLATAERDQHAMKGLFRGVEERNQQTFKDWIQGTTEWKNPLENAWKSLEDTHAERLRHTEMIFETARRVANHKTEHLTEIRVVLRDQLAALAEIHAADGRFHEQLLAVHKLQNDATAQGARIMNRTLWVCVACGILALASLAVTIISLKRG